MKPNTASKRFTVIIITLTVLMTIFIFVHSMLPADLSSRESGFFGNLIAGLFRIFGFSRAQGEHILRKLAHFSEFTVLGGLLTSCAYCFNRVRPWEFLFRILFGGLLTAVTDETIQLFSAGRAGMIADVWIDFSGVVFGTMIMLLFYRIIRSVKNIR